MVSKINSASNLNGQATDISNNSRVKNMDIASAMMEAAKNSGAAISKTDFQNLLKQIDKNNVISVIEQYNSASPKQSIISMILHEWGSNDQEMENALIGNENDIKGLFTLLLDKAKEVGVNPNKILEYQNCFEKELGIQLGKNSFWGQIRSLFNVDSSKLDKIVEDVIGDIEIQMTREVQYKRLAKSVGIRPFSVKEIQDMKQLIDTGYIDANGNVTEKPENIQVAGRYVPTQKDIENMKYVYGKTLFVDNFGDHNQMLDAMEYAENNGVKIQDAQVLINFDSHSDVYTVPTKNESIGNWVNMALAKNPNITDFYWVVPDEMVEDAEMDAILSGDKIINKFMEAQNPLIQNFRTKANLMSGESVQTYYICPETKALSSENPANGKAHQIRIHITVAKNLPNFSNKKVITSLDMDYFSNSGVDTVTQFRNNKNAEELSQAFSEWLQILVEHNIQPIMHGNCYSDDNYLPSEDFSQVKDFASEIIKVTPQQKDILNEYNHNNGR